MSFSHGAGQSLICPEMLRWGKWTPVSQQARATCLFSRDLIHRCRDHGKSWEVMGCYQHWIHQLLWPSEVQLLLLWRLGDFHIDDGSGPWLRDRILMTASEAEDQALPLPEAPGRQGLDGLLQGSGLVAVRKVEGPPADEWELTRRGQLHREVGSKLWKESPCFWCRFAGTIWWIYWGEGSRTNLASFCSYCGSSWPGLPLSQPLRPNLRSTRCARRCSHLSPSWLRFLCFTPFAAVGSNWTWGKESHFLESWLWRLLRVRTMCLEPTPGTNICGQQIKFIGSKHVIHIDNIDIPSAKWK